MEVVHIVLGKANPQRMNGVNKVVFQLATRQAATGRKVSIWGISKSSEHNYGERLFDTVLFKAQRNPFRIDPMLEKAILAKKGLATFHLHGGWIPAFSTLSEVLNRASIPFVFTPHGAYNTIAMQRSRLVKKLYFKIFEKQLLDRAKKIHCIGESEVNGLASIYQTNKTFLMHYGFETSAGPRNDAPARGKKFIIGFVGRLDVYTKGLDLLIDAFEEFHGFNPLSTLWIVGDGPGRQQLERRIGSRNLDSSAILWGSKFNEEKDKLMAKMDVFVHPSRNEGLPMSVLEAAAMRIPCIVSEATNVGALVGKYGAGRVIRNENVGDLVLAFEEMYLLKSTSHIGGPGENARQMVDEAFNWEAVLKVFDSLYH